MSYTDAIVTFANAITLAGGTVTQVDLDKAAYDGLCSELKLYLPVDLHEADYDRPSSPWYGSRPNQNATSLSVHTDAGIIRIGCKK